MRIIIEVDQTGVISARLEGAAGSAEPLDAVAEPPPPEILEAAKRLGAKSAGPAAVRRVARTAGGTGLPSSVTDTLAARRGDEDAGAAPAAPRGAPRGKAPAGKRTTAITKTRPAAKKHRR